MSGDEDVLRRLRGRCGLLYLPKRVTDRDTQVYNLPSTYIVPR